MLRTMLNPARVRFFTDVLVHDLRLTLWRRRILDVGCGGGILAEEFARLGLSVTGVDPSLASVPTARNHSCQSRLAIHYLTRTRGNLPFADHPYHIVVFPHVLEHVAS